MCRVVFFLNTDQSFRLLNCLLEYCANEIDEKFLAYVKRNFIEGKFSRFMGNEFETHLTNNFVENIHSVISRMFSK